MLVVSNNRGTLVSRSLAAFVLIPFLGAFLSIQNIVLFHITIETFCIFIAMSMLLIAVNTYQHNSNYFVLFLGLSYGFVAYFDFLHIISSKGFNIIAPNDSQISMQLWIIARYFECISLFLACFHIKRKNNINLNVYFILYLLAATILTPAVLKFHLFPSFYSIDIHVTNFVKFSSLILLAIIFMTIITVIKSKDYFNAKIYKFLIASLTCIGIYILLFTALVEMHSYRFVLGHIFKFASFYLIYKGIIETNLKTPYQQLRESEAYYKRLFHFSPDGIMIQKSKEIVFVNPAFLKILGIQQDSDIIGKSVLEFLPKEFHDKVILRKKAIKQGEQIGGQEFPLLRTDGTQIYIEVVTTIIPSTDDSEYLSIIRNISERKASEELKARMELEEAELKQKIAYEEMKAEFFTSISHDLKTPLNVILGTNQLLNVILIDTDNYSKTKKYINITKQNCFRLLKLINNVLDISKYDNNQFSLQLKNYDIISLIENTTLSIRDYIESKGIQLIFDTELEECCIACDVDKIERVILNLLSNAIKFTQIGGKIEVSIYDKMDYISVAIKDTGIGIPASSINNIFDRYKQVTSSKHKNHQGTGLGLALVKSIVEAHGGSITVSSEENKGSEFSFILPNKTIEDEYLYESAPTYLSSNIEKIHIEFSDVYSNIC